MKLNLSLIYNASTSVCPTTMKRICRQQGISRWPSRKINKVNRSISQLKQVIESVQVAEVPLDLNSLIRPLPVAPGPVHPGRDSAPRDEGLSTSHFETFEGVDRHPKLPSSEPVADHGRTSSSSRTSSSEGTMKTHEACGIQQTFSANSKQLASLINLSEDRNPACVVVEGEADMPIGDSVSSKSARNPPSASASIPEPKAVVIKARYRDDVVRFRMAADAGIAALNEEIGKRLMMEVGTFDIKYLDDDHDWVKLACDEDLEECLETSAASGSSVIRLAVQASAACAL